MIPISLRGLSLFEPHKSRLFGGKIRNESTRLKIISGP